MLAKFMHLQRRANPRILQDLKRGSEILERINYSFHAMLRDLQNSMQPFNITCFYEELPLPGLGFVSR